MKVWEKVKEAAVEHTVKVIVGVLLGTFLVLLLFLSEWIQEESDFLSVPNWVLLVGGLVVALLLLDWLQLRIKQHRGREDRYGGFEVGDVTLGFSYRIKHRAHEWIEDDVLNMAGHEVDMIVDGPNDIVGTCRSPIREWQYILAQQVEIIPRRCPFCHRETRIEKVTEHGSSFAVRPMKRAVLLRLQNDYRLGARVGSSVNYRDIPYEAVQNRGRY